nr:MAG: capsid protein [Crogonang virus 146]
MPTYGRGYNRPRAYSKKRVVRKRRAPASTGRRRLVALIRRTVLKRGELKMRDSAVAKTNLYHNCFYNITGIESGLMIHLNAPLACPPQGVGDNQRVGDEVQLSAYKIRLLIGQQADRPNVNWRWNVFRVPKGSSISYNDWFRNRTSNVLIDEPNIDFVTKIKSGFWRPNEAGLAGGGGDEYTFTKVISFSYKKTLKFGPGEGAITHNDDDLYFSLMGYDAFGTLLSDIVGYAQASFTVYYRDP